ncbi:hypothetical protein [Paenibacillus terrigena]|uniref:hypothetical protein n=1 Tax=Paenibacillus terrigena TaxID=369333 RepID=UPI00039A1AD7|nr:hypothetical protein [Paenibacillus terrigena]
MMYNQQWIVGSVYDRVIHEQDVELYLRCPCCYERKLKEQSKSHIRWEEHVEKSIQDVLLDFYAMIPEQRTERTIAQIIERRWTKKNLSFESEEQHHHIKTYITMHLKMLLTDLRRSENPMYLLTEMTTMIEELGAHLTMLFQVIEWRGAPQESSYIVRKLFIHDEPQLIKSYLHICLLFTTRMFGVMPQRMEVFTLLTGKSYIITPELSDIERSLDYVHVVSRLMQECVSNHQNCLRH